MEIQSIFDFIYGQLSIDTTIIADCSSRIYEEVAPEEAAYPFILISLFPLNDTVGGEQYKVCG